MYQYDVFVREQLVFKEGREPVERWRMQTVYAVDDDDLERKMRELKTPGEFGAYAAEAVLVLRAVKTTVEIYELERMA